MARRIFDEEVYLVDLVDDRDMVTDVHFERCTIHGPAVVAPTDATNFDSCTFSASAEQTFWVLPESAHGYMSGMVGLRGVTFDVCNLERIGVVCGPGDYQALLDGSR